MITNSEVRAANKMLKEEDASGLYPFFGRYNVTVRAIRSVAVDRKEKGECATIEEYIRAVRQRISDMTAKEVERQGKRYS